MGIAELAGSKNDWLWVWLIVTGVGIVVYFSARSAIKVRVQVASFTVPLSCVTPVCLAILLGICELWKDDPCTFESFGPPIHAFWKCQGNVDFLDMMNKQLLWIAIFWWLSQIWIAQHIWIPKNERLAKTDK